MTSIVDVARRAGVGIATVSRTINGESGVRESTRLRIESAMRELAYTVPDPVHRRGPRHRTSTLTYHVRILHQGGLARYYTLNPLFASILGALDERFNQAGHRLEIRNGVTPARGDVAGTVFIGPHGSAHTIPLAQFPGPALWLMGDPGTFPCDHVGPHHVKIGLMAAEYALKRGHDRAAYLGRSRGTPANHLGRRGDAFAWRMEQGGAVTSLLLDERLAAAIPAGEAVERAAITTLLTPVMAPRKRRPTVMFVDGDSMLRQLYLVLRDLGIEPMRDIEIISCNHEEALLQQIDPKPISLDLNPGEIGRRAADQLMARARDPSSPFVTLLVSPRFVFPD